ncbi:hypothetical protein HHI36_009109, partial [Cryptolaemus montrouzieri]
YCIQCVWCPSEGVANACRLGTDRELSCEGKMCYSYMYDLKYDEGYRHSYHRGCTEPQMNACGGMGTQNCTLCTDNDFCNNVEMPTRGKRSNK